MKSQWRAIAWKQLRETGPLAAVAVAGVLVVVLIVHFINSQNSLNSELGEILGGTSLSVGFFVILVAGVGLFLEDFAPRVNNFWRSRPVNINLWFVVKYLTGLSVLVLAFGSLLLLAYWLQTGISFEFDQEFILATFFGAYSVIILFTLAMTSYCLLRQPLYAVVVTLAFFLCGMMTIDWLFPDPSYIGIGIAVMILVLALLSRIAYLAVKHDWGRKVGR